jgi:membrane protein implicated in regulation of membrane protease activity
VSDSVYSVAGDPGVDATDLPRRRLYFLSGFDPRGASFYYRLFGEQVRRLRRRSGRPLAVGHRRGQQRDRLISRWQVHEDGALGLDFCFLHWDDIARAHWPRNPLVLVRDGIGIYIWYLLGGGYRRIRRWSPQVALCGLYPTLYAALVLLVLALAGGLLGVLVAPLSLPAVVVPALQILLVGLGCWQAWRLAEALGVVWLFRSIRFTHRLGQARDGDLRQRVGELAERILQLEREDPAGQVWLVGHSSGSFVMAMVAAELRRRGGDSLLEGRLQLLSLGQNLANLAVHGKARGFHADLALLAQEPRHPWRDITSRHDYLCFAAVDPYQSCGVPCPGAGAYPDLQLIPLAQRQGLTGLGALLSHQFDLHFEYLRTAEPHCSGGFDLIEQLLAP